MQSVHHWSNTRHRARPPYPCHGRKSLWERLSRGDYVTDLTGRAHTSVWCGGVTVPGRLVHCRRPCNCAVQFDAMTKRSLNHLLTVGSALLSEPPLFRRKLLQMLLLRSPFVINVQHTITYNGLSVLLYRHWCERCNGFLLTLMYILMFGYLHQR